MRGASSLVALALLTACAGGPEPCATSAACPAGTVCQPSGACAPLGAEGRFARTEWIAARGWAVTRADRPSAPLAPTDVLLVGGEMRAAAHFTFGPLPEEATVARAWLRLAPHESWSGPAGEARMVAHRTHAFDPGRLTRRTAPAKLGGPVAERPVLAGGPRPIVLDVTGAARRVQRAHRSWLHVTVEIEGAEGLPFRLSSPRAVDPARRPRLELSLR